MARTQPDVRQRAAQAQAGRMVLRAETLVAPALSASSQQVSARMLLHASAMAYGNSFWRRATSGGRSCERRPMRAPRASAFETSTRSCEPTS